MKNFDLEIYLFSLSIGLLLGLLFSRIQYHKGKRDAYEEMERKIQKMIDKYEEA